MKVRIKWVTTGGRYGGNWLVETEDGKRAGGTWGDDCWEIEEDCTTGDIDWDQLLDNNDFWQGVVRDLDCIDTDPSTGLWDTDTQVLTVEVG